jgi:hypothetical protein
MSKDLSGSAIVAISHSTFGLLKLITTIAQAPGEESMKADAIITVSKSSISPTSWKWVLKICK